MKKECATCGGSFPDGCVCDIKGKMPIWINIKQSILVPEQWLETLVKMSEGELEHLDLIKLQGFAQSAKTILKYNERIDE